MKLRSMPMLVLSLLAVVGSGCTYGHQEAQSGPYQPLVFPGEARVGASALVVIDSNYFQIGDLLERYDLHRDRVKILVDGNLGSAYANVRSVFAVESGRASDDAELRHNAWVMVALFDLPAQTTGIFSAPYPRHAKLHLEVDGETAPALEGVIWVIGEGGEPTALAMPSLPSVESELEPRTMVRLRARDSGASGFKSTWTIGSIGAEIRYDRTCLANPGVHVGSDAFGAGAFLSAPSPADGNFDAVQLSLTHPRGFQLPVATSADPTRLGQGPIIDITFDRRPNPSCSAPLASYFQIHHLVVSKRDGTLLLSLRDAGAATSDSSAFFYRHYVDPERPL